MIIEKKIGSFDLADFLPAVLSMKEEVTASLAEKPKRLSPKYFYDERGSALFEQICLLPEYYLTRTEIGILKEHRDEISAETGDRFNLVELGAGAVQKVQILLEGHEGDVLYVPLDISRDFLLSSVEEFQQSFPGVQTLAVCTDYHKDMDQVFDYIHAYRQAPNVIFFPGSTLGNFTPADAAVFLKKLHRNMQQGDLFVIGMDLKKDRRVLEAAYNDERGVTADFNLNILHHINAELGADFDPALFEHDSFYNDELDRIEMHLKSKADHIVHIDTEAVHFKAGESIHTENSYKLPLERVKGLFDECGFHLKKAFFDDKGWFGVFLLTR